MTLCISVRNRSASVSVCLLEAANEEALQLLHRQADIAMYYAKRPARTRSRSIHRDERGREPWYPMPKPVQSMRRLQTRSVGDALSAVLRCISRIEYYEALVRMRGEHGLIMLQAFFRLLNIVAGIRA